MSLELTHRLQGGRHPGQAGRACRGVAPSGRGLTRLKAIAQALQTLFPTDAKGSFKHVGFCI
jgi:hypothetical protein